MPAEFKFTRPGKYAANIEPWQQETARNLTMAFRDGAKILQTQTRAAIISAGLGPRFARQFKAFAYPRRQFSMDPVIRGFHARGWRGSKIGRYANIFARGGTITGKPLLWVPLPTAPKRIAGQAPTPKLFIENIGPLVSLHGTRRPILAGRSMRAVQGRRATVAQLQTGARRQAAGRHTEIVPMFVGVRSVRIRKMVDMDPIFARVTAQLPELFRARQGKN
jgi:hypothetical protein